MSFVFSPAIDALGWSLIHFIWQGTAIALALGLVLQTLNSRSAQLRYLVIGLTFIMMLGTFGITLMYFSNKPIPPEETGADPRTQHYATRKPAKAPVTTDQESPNSRGQGPVSKGLNSIETITYPLSVATSSETEPRETWTFFSSRRISSLLPWIVAIWIGGVIIFSLRMLWGLLRFHGCRSSGEEPADPAWKARFAAICKVLNVSNAVRLLSSSSVPVPIVVGWLKPAILVPTSLFSLLTVPQLEAILAHELAHIRRHDFLVNLLQNVTETIFFFHPAIWWVSAQLRKEREHCCDDVASDQCGGAIEYAKALTALEEICALTPAMSVAATGGSLLERVRRLLGAAPPESRPAYTWPASVLAFLLVTGFATGAHFVNGLRKSGETGAPIVHGYSLEGVPSITNDLGVSEIPETPRFTMSVEADSGEPNLIYPVGNEKPHFYLQYHDRTYGPIEGDPFKRMNLTKVLAGQFEELDERSVTDRLIEMLDLGDDVMLEASYKLIPQLKDYDHQSIAATLREGIYGRLRSTTIARKGIVAFTEVNDSFLAAVRDEAQERWKAMRTEIPESEYHFGKSLDEIAGEPSIQWGDPNEDGLRLGISGIDTAKPVPVGRNLEFKLFIRNDSEKEVKFTPPGHSGAGFFVMLVTEAGWGLHQKPGSERSVEKRVRLAPNQIYEVQLAPTQTMLYNEIGVPTTRKVQPSAWAVKPGRYWIEFDYQLGVFDVNSDWGELDPKTVPGLGEWTGILAGKPLEIEFAPPEIMIARPGDTVNFSDRHQLRFEEGSVSLVHRLHWPDEKRNQEEGFDEETGDWNNAPWGPVADVWKIGDHPEGNYAPVPEMWKMKDPDEVYLAAWDVGGTRLWIRKGDDGIQHLEFHHTFHDGGHWKMNQAVDHLGYMPDGVRAALNLPSRFYMRSPYANSVSTR